MIKVSFRSKSREEFRSGSTSRHLSFSREFGASSDLAKFGIVELSQRIYKPTTFFQPLIWSLLGLAKFGVGKFSQRIYKPTPFPAAVHLELFQISQGWNSGAFAEDLQADNFLSAVNLEPFRISQILE